MFIKMWLFIDEIISLIVDTKLRSIYDGDFSQVKQSRNFMDFLFYFLL